MEFKGGGRSSARETIGRVAAGAVAKKILKLRTGTEVRFIVHLFFNGCVTAPMSAMQHKCIKIQNMVGYNSSFFLLGFVLLPLYDKLLSLFAEIFETVSVLCHSSPLT